MLLPVDESLNLTQKLINIMAKGRMFLIQEICTYNFTIIEFQVMIIISILQSPSLFNLLPDIPFLGSSYSAASKDTMTKIWTNVDTII